MRANDDSENTGYGPCSACGCRQRLRRWQTFANGGIHLREECGNLNCRRFMRWLEQSSGMTANAPDYDITPLPSSQKSVEPDLFSGQS